VRGQSALVLSLCESLVASLYLIFAFGEAAKLGKPSIDNASCNIY
jgi:hypothetical protein